MRQLTVSHPSQGQLLACQKFSLDVFLRRSLFLRSPKVCSTPFRAEVCFLRVSPALVDTQLLPGAVPLPVTTADFSDCRAEGRFTIRSAYLVDWSHDLRPSRRTSPVSPGIGPFSGCVTSYLALPAIHPVASDLPPDIRGFPESRGSNPKPKTRLRLRLRELARTVGVSGLVVSPAATSNRRYPYVLVCLAVPTLSLKNRRKITSNIIRRHPASTNTTRNSRS